jgi:hypothetical protein
MKVVHHQCERRDDPPKPSRRFLHVFEEPLTIGVVDKIRLRL